MLWPLRVMPVAPATGDAGDAGDAGAPRPPWHVLRALADEAPPRHPWREVVDEYTGDASRFHERHYNEFVTFLPYVQRFLYGERRARRGAAEGEGGDASMRVFRRHDVAAMRVVTRPGEAPLVLDVVHVDLYFFFDVDVVMLNVEVGAGDLSLAQAQELLYRFGRAYPAGWDEAGQALHCLASAEWLDAEGRVLARSDAHDREAFLAHVSEHRAPRIAAHWAYLLAPLVPDMSSGAAAQSALRVRLIEYYRIPLMGFLALDDPRALTRNDFIRLGLVVGSANAGDSAADIADGSGVGGSSIDGRSSPGDGALPYGEQHVADFESRYCYDRFWTGAGAAPNTRYLCNGHALIVVGEARSAFYGCRDRGVLAQFRHQHFLLFLIAHFQKAALLMASDRLVDALERLDVRRPASVKRFKRDMRASFENFLRFTHRYWFHEISEQAQVRALFHMCAGHLGLDALYAEVKERIDDMSAYLEADSLRRQANTVVRLTVVTIFGLIGTVTTGFLGMNLLAEADASPARKLWLFAATFAPTVALTVYTMAKSRRLSDFLDALSDERLSTGAKLGAFVAVWRRADDRW
jgi:hypothetical protein